MMKTVVVQDILTSYSSSGDGEALVFLHGWGDSKETFNFISDALKDKYRCISIDLPGFGGTQKPSEAFDLARYAEFVREFLNKIEVNEVYAFIGHSNGGAIAMKGTSGGVLKSEKLVLLASSGVRNPSSKRNLGLRLVAKAAKQVARLMPHHVQQTMKRRAYKAIGSDVFVAEDLRSTFEKIVSEDIRSQATAIRQDTILIYGDKDTATPVAYGEYFASAIKKSRLKIIPDAGHFLHVDQPEKVLSEIRTFLR